MILHIKMYFDAYKKHAKELIMEADEKKSDSMLQIDQDELRLRHKYPKEDSIKFDDVSLESECKDYVLQGVDTKKEVSFFTSIFSLFYSPSPPPQKHNLSSEELVPLLQQK